MKHIKLYLRRGVLVKKSMKKDSDVLTFNNILDDIAYAGIGDRNSKRKTFILVDSPKGVAEIESRSVNEHESYDLQEGMKIKIPPNIIDRWTRLEVLLELRLPDHTDI